jgi:hypothetical protein
MELKGQTPSRLPAQRQLNVLAESDEDQEDTCPRCLLQVGGSKRSVFATFAGTSTTRSAQQYLRKCLTN